MLTIEEHIIYMQLSPDPNERGRIWKEIRREKEKAAVAKEMQQMYEEILITKLESQA